MTHDSESTLTHHIVSPVVYVGILAVLFVLTGVTVWVAFHDFGVWNDVIALAIAVTKATLVVLFFMHVFYGTRMTRLTVVAAAVWLLLLLLITLSDFFSRGWLVPGR